MPAYHTAWILMWGTQGMKTTWCALLGFLVRTDFACQFVFKIAFGTAPTTFRWEAPCTQDTFFGELSNTATGSFICNQSNGLYVPHAKLPQWCAGMLKGSISWIYSLMGCFRRHRTDQKPLCRFLGWWCSQRETLGGPKKWWFQQGVSFHTLHCRYLCQIFGVYLFTLHRVFWLETLVRSDGDALIVFDCIFQNGLCNLSVKVVKEEHIDLS